MWFYLNFNDFLMVFTIYEFLNDIKIYCGIVEFIHITHIIMSKKKSRF